jgi:hypothetical protein
MNNLESFKQDGGMASSTASALGQADLVKVSITGSRGGQAVEQVSALFNSSGLALTDDLQLKKGAIPIDLSGVAGPGGGVAIPPEVPTKEYQEALTQSVDKAQEIVTAHQKALTQYKSGGHATVEDGIIEAALRYCWDHLKFSPVDVPDKFVISRKDVVLSKENKYFKGLVRWVYEVRLASRFG